MTTKLVLAPLPKRRFDALAGYCRHPMLVTLTREIEWHRTPNERVIGTLTRDLIDDDFGYVVLGRDKRLRYRAIDVNTSHPTEDSARKELFDRMLHHNAKDDASFHQGDEEGEPVDFFTPLVDEADLHPSFKILANKPHYSPARELITAMMRSYEDLDGNFIQQFQTTGFDARLWELYLFATFTELDFAQAETVDVPDFVLFCAGGRLGIEATTINPPNDGAAPNPKTEEEFLDYLENYIPIKINRALKKKLNKKTPYWEKPEMEGIPFLIALQDFHSRTASKTIVNAATECIFGYRHSISDGKLSYKKLSEHAYCTAKEKSGFFGFPKSENVAAVLLNPQGTLPKFNRMGFLAGFGNSDVKMIRRGLQRNEHYEDSPGPKFFVQEVHKAGYEESWVEGMVALHNPNAVNPIPPEAIPGACHEFLQTDGSIMSLYPDFHPLFSETAILLPKNGE